MMLLGAHFGLVGSVALAAGGAVVTGTPIELKGGDRVVLVGSTLIERDGESGYLETRVARRYPGQTIVWRNLGWSGDTVDGITRGKPNPATDGFSKLVEHVAALKPTVIILGYGANEAFSGSAGLPAFGAGLDRLWKAMAATGAKIVVLTPIPQAKLAPPLPDPSAHNADLKRVRDVLLSEAARRGAVGVDLFDAMPMDERWTTNGVHLSPTGYWRESALIAPALAGPPVPAMSVTLDDGPVGPRLRATGATVSDLTRTPLGWKFQVQASVLPEPNLPDLAETPPVSWDDPALRRLLKVGVDAGHYRLLIDGNPVVELSDQTNSTEISGDPDARQVEALRAAINRKNLLYFHRWRPQNETYLFGFRKHEQGRNAAELAAFDPLIAAAEAEIARLSQPVTHTYELELVRPLDRKVQP